MLTVPIKTTLSDARTTHYVALLNHLTNRTRWVLKDLDPTNDLTSLRIRSKKHEIIVVPGSELAFAWRESGKTFRENTSSIPDRDSNLGIPVLSSLVQHETSALANYATELANAPVVLSQTFEDGEIEVRISVGIKEAVVEYTKGMCGSAVVGNLKRDAWCNEHLKEAVREKREAYKRMIAVKSETERMFRKKYNCAILYVEYIKEPQDTIAGQFNPLRARMFPLWAVVVPCGTCHGRHGPRQETWQVHQTVPEFCGEGLTGTGQGLEDTSTQKGTCSSPPPFHHLVAPPLTLYDRSSRFKAINIATAVENSNHYRHTSKMAVEGMGTSVEYSPPYSDTIEAYLPQTRHVRSARINC
uniref:Roadblock/LAMTOR2 domain-containing protein n=1 Tax=Timema bartmani TaxID=61472 RepID=A0A7R9F435_9NEOP|nr:unnamed protein product [Timema bartmani]